jgi:hypothetical protein
MQMYIDACSNLSGGIAGDYRAVAGERFTDTDTVVWLDLPRPLCWWRACFRRNSVPEIACIKWIWRYPGAWSADDRVAEGVRGDRQAAPTAKQAQSPRLRVKGRRPRDRRAPPTRNRRLAPSPASSGTHLSGSTAHTEPDVFSSSASSSRIRRRNGSPNTCPLTSGATKGSPTEQPSAYRLATLSPLLVVSQAGFVMGEEDLADQLSPAVDAGLVEDVLEVLLHGLF